MNWDDFNKSALALVTWREAMGEGQLGMLAVAHVIRNRVLATHLPDTWDDIIFRKWQFSSMTAAGDAMLTKWPLNTVDAKTFGTAMEVAEAVYGGQSVDPTGGANLYANLDVCSPAWAVSPKVKKLGKIGHHTFFRE